MGHRIAEMKELLLHWELRIEAQVYDLCTQVQAMGGSSLRRDDSEAEGELRNSPRVRTCPRARVDLRSRSRDIRSQGAEPEPLPRSQCGYMCDTRVLRKLSKNVALNVSLKWLRVVTALAWQATLNCYRLGLVLILEP